MKLHHIRLTTLLACAYTVQIVFAAELIPVATEVSRAAGMEKKHADHKRAYDNTIWGIRHTVQDITNQIGSLDPSQQSRLLPVIQLLKVTYQTTEQLDPVEKVVTLHPDLHRTDLGFGYDKECEAVCESMVYKRYVLKLQDPMITLILASAHLNNTETGAIDNAVNSIRQAHRKLVEINSDDQARTVAHDVNNPKLRHQHIREQDRLDDERRNAEHERKLAKIREKGERRLAEIRRERAKYEGQHAKYKRKQAKYKRRKAKHERRLAEIRQEGERRLAEIREEIERKRAEYEPAQSTLLATSIECMAIVVGTAITIATPLICATVIKFAKKPLIGSPIAQIAAPIAYSTFGKATQSLTSLMASGLQSTPSVLLPHVFKPCAKVTHYLAQLGPK